MKALVLVSAFVLALSAGCDRSKGKGSDREWQEKQEEIERQEEWRQQEERSREVNYNPKTN